MTINFFVLNHTITNNVAISTIILLQQSKEKNRVCPNRHTLFPYPNLSRDYGIGKNRTASAATALSAPWLEIST